jgi:hypothetical protein
MTTDVALGRCVIEGDMEAATAPTGDSAVCDATGLPLVRDLAPRRRQNQGDGDAQQDQLAGRRGPA